MQVGNRKITSTSIAFMVFILMICALPLGGCSSSSSSSAPEPVSSEQTSQSLMTFSPESFVYYSGGRQQDLEIYTGRITVSVADENLDRLKAWLKADPLALKPPEIEELGRKNLALVSLVEGATEEQVLELIERLNASGLVDYATPVFGTEEELTLITDEFVVRFLDTYSAGEIEAYIASQGAVIVERDFLWPGCYRLSFTSGSGANVLEGAGAFYESGMVVFAHPDFITFAEPLWHTIAEEDFEGEFPKAGWSVYDQNPADGEYYWGKLPKSEFPLDLYSLGPEIAQNLLEESSGDYIGWCSAGHAAGLPDRAPGEHCPETYAPNMDAWLTVGPLDLLATYWAHMAYTARFPSMFGYGAKLELLFSTNGQDWLTHESRNYYPKSGGSLCLDNIDGIGDLTGQETIWIALRFIKDGTATEHTNCEAGMFIDDIMVQVSNQAPSDPITEDPLSALQWGLRNTGQSGGEPGWDINIEPAWTFLDEELGGLSFDDEDSIIVAVIDEGVDLNHEDLNLVAGYDATYDPDDPESVDSHGGPNPWDGHGTACAGIIGAKNNGTGIVGVAPGVKIMPVRIGSSQEGKTYWAIDSDLAEGILWAANNGAKVLSNSWGGRNDTDIKHNAIRDAKDMGCVAVFAAGNYGLSTGVCYPAKYEETIAVGAMSPCGEQKKCYRDGRELVISCDLEGWGSCWGPEVNVVAPGVKICTTDITGQGGYAFDDAYGHSGNYFKSFNGTSSATPHVAGIAALMLSLNPELEPDEVKDLLQMTAVDIEDAGFDEKTGYGLVDAYAAVTAARQYGDLSVSQLSAPSPAVAGQAVHATCRVTNSAPSSLGPLALRVYLSTDNQLDDQDTVVGEKIATIVSGSSDLDLNLLIPAETTLGSYLLIASVDDDGESLESNETNNTFIASLHVIDSACLVVKPAGVNFGTVVTGVGSQVNVELKNEGEGVLDTLVISGITFSGDAIFNNTEYNLIPETPVELETNESTYLGLYFMPETAGTYSGTITITSNDPNAPTTQIPLTGVATEPVTHTITASAGSGGSISPQGEIVVLDGVDRTFTITPDSCRYISDVLVDGSSVGARTSYTFENITAEHTISASFGLLTYAITASAGTGGSISPSNTVMVSCGGGRTFTITPDAHYHIENVLVDGVSVGTPSSYEFTSVDSPHTITASFAPDTHTLTVINAGDGIGTTTPSAGFHEYDYGTVVNLTESPDASSTFAGWSGDIESGDIVTMDGDKSVTATFTLKTFTITATAGENGDISPVGDTTVSCGGNQVYTFTPDTGYEVDTVTIDGQATAISGNSYTFTDITNNHTIDVTFKVLVVETAWSKTYGGTDVEEYPEQIVATDDGGYAFVADTRSFGDTSGDIWFVKLDASGAIEMEKGLGGDSTEHGNALIQTSDSGYLVAGSSYSYRTGSRYDDIWLIKLSSSGTVEWQRTYGDTGYEAPTAVRETVDELGDATGYIVAGYTTSHGAGGYDAWVLKLDLSGGIEWQKTYGGLADEFGRSIQATNGGGYVFTADTQSFGAGGRDVWVVKTGGTGVVEWEKTFGGAGWDMPESIQVCTDSGYVVGAYTDSFGAGDKDFWVIKLDSEGAIEWQYTYGGEDPDHLADLKTTDDGGYIMTGWSYSYTQPYWGDSNDAWVVKLDATGQIDWQRCYNKPYEDAGEIINAPDWAHSIVQAADGGYAVLGLTDDWDYNRNDDIWVLKVDFSGVLGCDIGMASVAVPDNTAPVEVSDGANPYETHDTEDSAETPAGSVFDTAADVFIQCSQEEEP